MISAMMMAAAFVGQVGEARSPTGAFTLNCHVPGITMMKWEGGRWISERAADALENFKLSVDTNRRTAAIDEQRFELSTLDGHIIASVRDSPYTGAVATIGYLGGPNDRSGPVTFRMSGPAAFGQPAFLLSGVGSCEVER